VPPFELTGDGEANAACRGGESGGHARPVSRHDDSVPREEFGDYPTLDRRPTPRAVGIPQGDPDQADAPHESPQGETNLILKGIPRLFREFEALIANLQFHGSSLSEKCVGLTLH
jgi:hypothetical protein